MSRKKVNLFGQDNKNKINFYKFQLKKLITDKFLSNVN